MATFIATLFTASTGAAAAGGAAAAATPGLFGLTLGQTIFAGASAFSALSSIAAGAAQSRELERQASFARIQASEEEERGAEQARRSALELKRLLGAQSAIYAASGVDISAGSPATVRERTIQEGEREIDITRRNAKLAAIARRRQARGLLSEASAARFGGFTQAVGTIGDAARVLL